MKFRKKPVVIEAIQFQGDWGSVREDFRAAIKHKFHAVNEATRIIFYIPTLEGDHQVKCGDWVIKGVKGEFYCCKPDIFEMTYEPVEETTSSLGDNT